MMKPLIFRRVTFLIFGVLLLFGYNNCGQILPMPNLFQTEGSTTVGNPGRPPGNGNEDGGGDENGDGDPGESHVSPYLSEFIAEFCRYQVAKGHYDDVGLCQNEMAISADIVSQISVSPTSQTISEIWAREIRGVNIQYNLDQIEICLEGLSHLEGSLTSADRSVSLPKEVSFVVSKIPSCGQFINKDE